ncbi:hypothetical protein CDL15_Pgr014562 [Punica granatum]|uniref:Uncharacterized protein n=1 Tax=Punica granatum TaxID=22663 RepID=A0A218WEG2_PUNGR|nr:hypothetical protein CDL15_Pgr014562 [Punica granatum]
MSGKSSPKAVSPKDSSHPSIAAVMVPVGCYNGLLMILWSSTVRALSHSCCFVVRSCSEARPRAKATEILSIRDIIAKLVIDGLQERRCVA